MEIEYNIKDHILYLCGKCGKMKIVYRADFDLKDSVFVILDCNECFDTKESNYSSKYYGKKGFLGDEEGNKFGIRNGFGSPEQSIN